MNTLEESAGKILTAISVSGRRERPIGPFCIGTVLVGSQEGLKISCGGMELTAEDLWINEDLLDSPESINSDPYGAWMIRISDIEDKEELMSAQEYEEFVKE